MSQYMIDPDSGWKYNFPKIAPTNIKEMHTDEVNAWLIANGYPKAEVSAWIQAGYPSPPYRLLLISQEIK